MATRRITRSQSRELSYSEALAQGLQRITRTVKPTTKHSMDLSIVDEYVQDDDDYEDDDNDDNSQDIASTNESQHRGSRFSSVGSDSDTHSIEEIRDLDPNQMMEGLKDLSVESDKILDFFGSQSSSKLSTDNLLKDLQLPRSEANKQLSGLFLDKYDRTCYNFGSDRYIDTSIAVRGLFGVTDPKDVGHNSWKLAPVFQRANLATLSILIIKSEEGTEICRGNLELLDRQFPKVFVTDFQLPSEPSKHSLGPGSSILYPETFDLALDLRTQYFISQVQFHRRHDPSFDPDEIIRDVFWVDLESGSPESVVKGWAVLGSNEDDYRTLPAEYQKKLRNRIRMLSSTFTNDSDNGSSLEQLEEEFSWDDFVYALMDWVKRRKNEIDHEIERFGGVINIQKFVKEELQRSGKSSDLSLSAPVIGQNQPTATHDGLSISASAPLRTSAGTVPKINAGVSFNNISFIRQMRQPISQKPITSSGQTSTPIPRGSNVKTSVSAPPKVRTERIEYQDDDWQPSIDGWGLSPGDGVVDTGEPPSPSQQLAREEASRLQQNEHTNDSVRRSGSRPKKRLLDRQEDASRVSPDADWEDSQTRSDRHPSKKSRRANNKTNNENDKDGEDDSAEPDQNSGYEKDTRPSDVRKRRASKPMPQQANRPPRRTQNDPQSSSATNSRRDVPLGIMKVPTPAQASTRAPSITPPQTQPSSSRAIPRGSQAYKELKVNEKAKMDVAASKDLRIQKRIPWSAEETETLIDLVGEIGTSWSAIEGHDNTHKRVLIGRNQGSLKDKARNIKMDFLKARIPLPKNFNLVVITGPMIAQLENMGLQYDQTRGTLKP
ncbi:MAG: hypothetical protein M1834_001050 [Cirrosporium novae-zelandiae]|nr:MAG: hypothetical protein M1834_001050 [Cirrosporium novae-zelandiae]